MNPRVSVLLVCERAEQLTGSGCCGKLEGDNALRDEGFATARQHRLAFGVLHRTVCRLFGRALEQGRLRIDVVDPRNQLYLAPRLWRDVCRYRPPWGAALRSALQMFAIPAVVVNGRVLSRGGRPPDPDSLCQAISTLLGGKD